MKYPITQSAVLAVCSVAFFTSCAETPGSRSSATSSDHKAVVAAVSKPRPTPTPASAETRAAMHNQSKYLTPTVESESTPGPILEVPSVHTPLTQNLTDESTGEEVVNLQKFLVKKKFLVMPKGVPMGKFAGLTKKATAAYQASVGISPAKGYVGPITRAHINADQNSFVTGSSPPT